MRLKRGAVIIFISLKKKFLSEMFYFIREFANYFIILSENDR